MPTIIVLIRVLIRVGILNFKHTPKLTPNNTIVTL